MDNDAIAKAERRVEKRRAKVEQTLVEKRRLKWIHLLLVLSPVGLIWAWWVAAWIVFAWITFWGVGAYMNYFHLREAENRLAQAQRELEELKAQASAPGG